MDQDTLTAIGVVAGVVSAVVAVLELAPRALTWWRNRKKPKVDERMVASSERLAQIEADRLAFEQSRERRGLMASFEVTHAGTSSSQHVIQETNLKVTNNGQHRAERIRIGLAPTGEPLQMRSGEWSLESRKCFHAAFRPFLEGDRNTYHGVIEFRDGTGDRRHTFTVHYKLVGEGTWTYDKITNAPQAVP